MDSDRKLTWAIFISLGCHFFILLMAAEYAPWKITLAGKKTPIVVQLTDLAAERKSEMAAENRAKRLKNGTPPTSEQSEAKKPTIAKEEQLPEERELLSVPAKQEESVSDLPVIRDRTIGNLFVEPRKEVTGNWHADYARKLSDIIKQNQRYPTMAVRNQLQGTVMIGFILHRTGKLIECHITQPCQHTILDRAALRAVKSVRSFPPFPDSIQWEQAGFVIPVTFRLDR